MNAIHVRISRKFVETGTVLSPDERGHRSCGYDVVTVWSDASGRASYDGVVGDADVGARWFASSLAGVLLPEQREEVDLGIAEWTSKKGTKIRCRLIGVVGPRELRVVFRHGYLPDRNTMCLVEETAPDYGGRRPKPDVERSHDEHGRCEFAGKRYEIPAIVVARIEEFYAAVRCALPKV